MCRLDIVWMIVSPRSAHPFGIPVVRNDVVIVGELLVADGAYACLLSDLHVQQFPHLPPAIEVPGIHAGGVDLQSSELQAEPVWAWEGTRGHSKSGICGWGTIRSHAVSWHSS